MAPSNSRSAASASSSRPKPISASASMALQLKMPGRAPLKSGGPGLAFVEPSKADQRVRLDGSPVEDARQAPRTEQPGGANRLCREQYPGQVAARGSRSEEHT